MTNLPVTFDFLDDSAYEQLLMPVWTYLAQEQKPEPSDVIFVFGGLGLEIPARAAELFRDGYADTVLITGSSGPLTQGVFATPEAEVFKAEMLKRGVNEEAILTETRATNTGQNVEFGMRAIHATGRTVSTAILVAKSFIMRRCVATFSKQFPNVRVIPCPPAGSPLQLIDRSRPEFAKRMVAELDRLQDYGQKGFIWEQTIPADIMEAAKRINSALV